MTDTASPPAPSGEVYGDHVFSHLRPDEAERLEALAQALDENTFRRLGRLPLRADWHCLEIGAGLGTTARWLAARCSRGRVVATDIDTRLFPDPGSRNGWEAREHDVTRDEFPAGSFDLIHARWVFSHLRSRDADLTRVARWLKPGGWLVVEDLAQFPLGSSPNPLYRKVSLAMCAAVQARIGTDCTWARDLPRVLGAAGLTAVGTEASASSVGPTPMGRFWQLSAEQLRSDLQETFGITTTELERFLVEVRSGGLTDLCLGTVAAWGQAPPQLVAR
ncbi:methyltransferase [Streptomyces hygroscopicus subsp. hygroscopicus]|nr:class I SAM-dependent methyltransferase [Streptomyces hygroscopicus]GLX49104.1 methyltransferase [Streptomyces hygroscopicus subsp. hygroscopicus]